MVVDVTAVEIAREMDRLEQADRDLREERENLELQSKGIRLPKKKSNDEDSSQAIC